MNSKPSRLFLYTACALAALVIAIVSCNKKFDAPPAYVPPNINANTSIADLKSKHVSGQVDSLSGDMIIGGTVIANDSSGNFYKQIVLQDSTGGIAVSIDDYNLYATFPIGRKVYVKLKGLFMSEDAGLLYIGGSPAANGSVAGIASRLKEQYIVKGELNVPVTPTAVTIADLKNNSTKYMYTLVQFNNFEVKPSDTAKKYAYATSTSNIDANIIVKGCGSNDTMIIRTSGYSNFASVNVPNGNGTLTAVYAFYKSSSGRITPQVVIRDTSDVQFTGARCNGTEPPPTSNAPLKTIAEVRALYSGSDVTLGSMKIGGVVISDVSNGNVGNGNVILQDGNAGISVFFGTSANITYKVGDSVVVDISGNVLKQYNGSLEIDAFGDTPPAAVAANKTVTPKEMTVATFNASLSTIEYTLVKIKSATLSGGSTYKGNLTLKDASGSTTLYTMNNASFAGIAVPASAKDWVGYGNFYKTTPELLIRNTNDVSDATSTGGGTGGGDTTGTGGGTTTPPPTTTADLMFSEYVEGSSNNKYIELYNAGTSAINLSDYIVRLYANGGTSATNSAKLDTLTGITSLPAGGIIVLKNSGATLALPAGVTAYSSNVTNFNGNDALIIEKSGTVIDVFGTVGIAPTGDSWTIAGDAKGAVDHTVRRLTSVLKGNTDWTTSSASEWSVGTKDDVSGLGIR